MAGLGSPSLNSPPPTIFRSDSRQTSVKESPPISRESSGSPTRRGSAIVPSGGRDLSAGSVAATCSIIDDKKLVISHVGDCRVYLSKDGKVEQLTNDHRPIDNQGEYLRLQNMGIPVSHDGYVNDRVAVTRSFGDITIASLAKMEGIICDPDVSIVDLTEDIEFILVGCDGIFECFPPNQLVLQVRRDIRNGLSAADAAKELVNTCLPKCTDNLTAMVLILKRPKQVERTAPKRIFGKRSTDSGGTTSSGPTWASRPSWAK